MVIFSMTSIGSLETGQNCKLLVAFLWTVQSSGKNEFANKFGWAPVSNNHLVWYSAWIYIFGRTRMQKGRFAYNCHYFFLMFLIVSFCDFHVFMYETERSDIYNRDNIDITHQHLLQKRIIRYGIPDRVLHDNGQQLGSKAFTSLCSYLGITKLKNSFLSTNKRPGEKIQQNACVGTTTVCFRQTKELRRLCWTANQFVPLRSAPFYRRETFLVSLFSTSLRFNHNWKPSSAAARHE